MLCININWERNRPEPELKHDQNQLPIQNTEYTFSVFQEPPQSSLRSESQIH
jgi:hypothetical protein